MLLSFKFIGTRITQMLRNTDKTDYFSAIISVSKSASSAFYILHLIFFLEFSNDERSSKPSIGYAFLHYHSYTLIGTSNIFAYNFTQNPKAISPNSIFILLDFKLIVIRMLRNSDYFIQVLSPC